MKDSVKKIKPTIEALLVEGSVVTGKQLVERHKEIERQKVLLQEAIDFEKRHRKSKKAIVFRDLQT